MRQNADSAGTANNAACIRSECGGEDSAVKPVWRRDGGKLAPRRGCERASSPSAVQSSPTSFLRSRSSSMPRAPSREWPARRAARTPVVVKLSMAIPYPEPHGSPKHQRRLATALERKIVASRFGAARRILDIAHVDNRRPLGLAWNLVGRRPQLRIRPSRPPPHSSSLVTNHALDEWLLRSGRDSIGRIERAAQSVSLGAQHAASPVNVSIATFGGGARRRRSNSTFRRFRRNPVNLRVQ